MARNQVIRRSFRSSPGRLTEWIAASEKTGATALPANTIILIESLTTAEKAKLPFTVTRVRGEIWFRSDQVAADEFVPAAYAMAIVSDEAIAAGAGSLPFPATNPSSDLFFVHQFLFAGIVLNEAAGTDQTVWQRYTIDSKAQRKVAPGSDIAVLIENSSATQGALFVANFRMLVKLS